MTAYRDRLEAGEYTAPGAGAGGFDSMTKAELLEYAQANGISPANNDMTKAELREAIEAAGG